MNLIGMAEVIAKGCKEYLDADDLGRVPKFDENPIAPRLIKVILDDFGSNGRLSFPQFVYFMSTFGQCQRGGHENHHHHHHHMKRHSSNQATTSNNISPTSTKTALLKM